MAMKSLIWTMLVVAAPTMSAQAVDRSARRAGEVQELHEYHLGQIAGRCLVARCSVFTGYVLAELPQTEGPLAIHVEERLYATGPIPDVVHVAYVDPLESDKRPAREIAQAWEGVVLQKNVFLTIVSAHEDASAARPVVVSSTPGDAEVIRSLSSEALVLQQSPEAIGGDVEILSKVKNPALAAFLVCHLERVETIDDPDTSATLLSQLVGNESVPAEAWEDIVDHIVLDYDRLTRGSRTAVIRRFVELGQSTDARFASSGLHGLDKIVNFDSSAWELAPPDAHSKLIQVYRNLVRTGAISRNPSLEAALRIAF
jgi:hypothetical protein